MAQINISDTVYARMIAFKPVIEAILEVSLENDAYIEYLLRLAPDLIMAQVLGGADARALYDLLQQLGHNHPETYGAIAEIIQKGGQAIQAETRAAVKRSLGFPDPNGSS